jgi:hypothetical protein
MKNIKNKGLYQIKKYNFNTKPSALLWKQEVNLFGHKLYLENSNAKKQIGMKIFETIKKYPTFKTQFFQSKAPIFVKFFMGWEVVSLIYQTFIKDKFQVINKLWEKSVPPILIQQEYNVLNTLSNCAIYFYIGKTLYLINRRLFYGINLLGLPVSYLMAMSNEKIKTFVSDQVGIEDFYIFYQNNIIPKLLLSSSIILFLNFFIQERVYRSKKYKFIPPLSRKAIFMFFTLFFLGKYTQFLSNFTTQNLKYK